MEVRAYCTPYPFSCVYIVQWREFLACLLSSPIDCLTLFQMQISACDQIRIQIPTTNLTYTQHPLNDIWPPILGHYWGYLKLSSVYFCMVSLAQQICQSEINHFAFQNLMVNSDLRLKSILQDQKCLKEIEITLRP